MAGPTATPGSVRAALACGVCDARHGPRGGRQDRRGPRGVRAGRELGGRLAALPPRGGRGAGARCRGRG
eukprot:10482800-Lingulodinium_polyedra.AAC.1